MIKLLNKLKHDSSSFYTYHHSTGAQTIAVLQRVNSFGPFFQFTLIIAFVLIILIFSAFLKEAVSLSYTESGTGIEKTDTCNNQKHSLKTCHKIRGVFSNRIFLWPRWVWLLIFNWCKESANWIINKYTESDSSYSINMNSPWIRWVENRHST